MASYDRRDPVKAYEEETVKAMAIMTAIQRKLVKHRKEFEKHPTHWTYVGDLTHLVEVLSDFDKNFKP